MAGELLSFGIQKLWYLLSQEHELFQGVESQVSELQRDLNLLSSFLKDADAKKHTTAVVRNVVEEIQEIVYDAEDIIETYVLKERLGKTSGINMSIRRLACIIPDRRRNSLDIGGIRTRISDAIRDMQSFGVQQAITDGGYMQPLGDRQRAMRQTFPMDYESDFVGLEENVNKLVGYFVEEDDVQVVSITGMGGLGKTTLARQVFNHEMVKNKFNRLAWVCVSQDFTRISVWQTILQNLTSKEKKDEILKMKEADLQDELFRLLETSKSLIVLDDIWKDEDWDLIKPIFPPDKGWKVLLTSRNESVAMREDAKYVNFKPECLTIPDSWILFKRIAFRRKDASESKVDEEMEEMGKQMIKHCGGLPLAVRVLGGLLAAKYTLHDWKRVSENIGSHLVECTSSKNGSIDQVLSMSFEELPSYLKHCFLYLAHFPEDYPINVANLSYYWAAEGIPRPRGYNGATIQEVADGYIEELVKRNIVISQRDAITSRFKTCQLHDMMREVCLRKAKEENFVDIVGSANSQSPCKSRRIAVHELDESYDTKGMMKNPKLRSLLFIGNPSARGWMMKNPGLMMENPKLGSLFLFIRNLTARGWKSSDLLFRRLQLLRALDLSYANFKGGNLLSGGKLPSSIGKLIHLRYLSLFEAKVNNLPSSMRNLKQLLYLNLCVSSYFPIYMPNDLLNEMRELLYLNLPWEIHDKVKMELGNLVKLETLENFSTKHSSLRDLQRMTRLETLKILFNGGCARETLFSSLKELRHLENLTILDYRNDEEDYRNDEEGFVLDFVHLKYIYLSIYMPRLPDEQHFPSHLTTLSLDGCRLEEDPMPILEKLLQLKEVTLWERSFCGRRMVCSGGGFPQLQKLKLIGLEEWEEWIVEEGSMPLLHTLEITRCKKLKELPDGLRFIHSLKELGIYQAPLELKEKLSRGGEDFYKVQHIPLLTIELEEESNSD